MDHRRELLAQWLNKCLQSELKLTNSSSSGFSLDVVSGDASFRRYFRARIHDRSWIAVDAPPEKEDSHPFVAIARGWKAQGVNVPEVYAADFEQGFMLLSDFGDRVMLSELNDGSVNDYYLKALDELLKIQQCDQVPGYDLPAYDEKKLVSEMALCPDWFFSQLLGMELSAHERQMLDLIFGILIESALDQSRVVVHRDYHSRNLMITEDGSMGVLDFQDAVMGPISYDLVSLLRDCYISWPEARLQHWVEQYADRIFESGLITAEQRQRFRRAFDLMGMQRHIKCVGIFSRLNLRDGKSGYLKDIPRTFAYIQQVSGQYRMFAEFSQWLEERVIPAMNDCGYFGQIESFSSSGQLL